MRLISFSMTVASFLDGSKSVTRRLGWKTLRPGDVLMGVEKAQGLKRGEKIKKLGALEVIDVRREPLSAIGDEGFPGVAREGLAPLSPDQFIEMFCKANGCEPTDEVTRIEFRRVVDVASDEGRRTRDPVMEIVRAKRLCACGHLEHEHIHDAPDAAPEAIVGSCWLCECALFRGRAS